MKGSSMSRCVTDPFPMTQEAWKAATAGSVPQSPVTSPIGQGPSFEGGGSSTGHQMLASSSAKLHSGHTADTAAEDGRLERCGSSKGLNPGQEGGLGEGHVRGRPRVPPVRLPSDDGTFGNGPSGAQGDSPMAKAGPVPPSPFGEPTAQRSGSFGGRRPPVAGHISQPAQMSSACSSAADALPQPASSSQQGEECSSSMQPRGEAAQGQSDAPAASGAPDVSTAVGALLGGGDTPGAAPATAASGGYSGTPGSALGNLGPAAPALINGGGANVARDAAESVQLPPRPTINTRWPGPGGGSFRAAGDSPRFGNITEGVPMPSESLMSNDSEGGQPSMRGRPDGEWPPPMTRSGRRRLRFCMLVRVQCYGRRHAHNKCLENTNFARCIS